MRVLALLFAAFLSLPGAAAAADSGLIFVVNPAIGAAELSVDEISDYYFKKKLRWPDGTKVQFIDQKDGSPRKELFLKLLGKSQRELDLFWIGEKNFSGSSAPLQVPSDSLVLSMVASLPGGIGYVAADRTDLGKAKQLQVKTTE